MKRISKQNSQSNITADDFDEVEIKISGSFYVMKEDIEAFEEDSEQISDHLVDALYDFGYLGGCDVSFSRK